MKKSRLTSNIKYNEKVANSYNKIEYYKANEENIKKKKFLESKSKRLSTPKRERVTEIIDEYKYGNNVENGDNIFKIIKRIYEKNKIAAFSKVETYNTNLINLVASIPVLMVSYAKVKKSRGSTTLANWKSNSQYNFLDPDQKNFLNKTDKGADGMIIEEIKEASKLIKSGKYPWGTSKRIYFDKPGAKRPITISPFMDKIVQEAIRYILVAIYEPYFDQMHCSLGFRPNKSTHDAIQAVTNAGAKGLDKALKGDVTSAYDKVNRKKLIEILGKKIKDRKFLNLIRNRLNYKSYNSEKDIFTLDKDGIPQGGTDSPYLWNIYMLEFDIFIMTKITAMIDETNIKTRGPNSKDKKILDNERNNFIKHKFTLGKIITWIHKKKKKNKDKTFKEDLLKLAEIDVKRWHETEPFFPKKLHKAKTYLTQCKIEESSEKEIRDYLQKESKILKHRINHMPNVNENKKYLRMIYCRYADDWIILTNVKEEMLLKIKEKISTFLKEELYATLSDEKTLITNIKENPAHFLGFEIKTYTMHKIAKGKVVLNLNTNRPDRMIRKKKQEKLITKKTAGKRVFALPDKQRLMDRLHMKGYCDKDGFPREITKLNNLEAFTIIDRINSVLLSITNYYANFIRNPRTNLSRWIYIIRYSCIKTLALKYKMSTRKILKKFKPEQPNDTERTIEDSVIIEVNGDRFKKNWKLYTTKELLEKCTGKNAQLRKKEIKKRYCSLKKGQAIEFEEKENAILLSDKETEFLERSNWVNKRTMAIFDLPCSICGSTENIEMRHVKHVRKVKYSDIKKDKTWQQVMGLRNRKQIPVCRSCHMTIIDKGLYDGGPMKEMSINKMYDNKIVNSECFVHKGKANVDYRKSLIENGWKLIINE